MSDIEKKDNGTNVVVVNNNTDTNINNNKNINVLTDRNGKPSSKRLWGSILVGIAIILGIVTWALSLGKTLGDSATCLAVINILIIVGAGLLGSGIAENFANKVGSNNNGYDSNKYGQGL
jgi:hypothetical protein